MDPIRVTVVRGTVVEAVHRVHGVLVREGRVVRAFGDVDLVTFWRSGAKPVQALPLLRAAPELPDEELAIACSSHEARPDQLAAAGALLARAGVGEEALECGPQDGRRLRHNCSGKHAGMLLVCRRRGWPLGGYRLPDHPLQRELRELVAAAAGMPSTDLVTAPDGCGVVTFALPLRRMALAFDGLARGVPDGAARALAAMRAFPELIGGPASSDTRLMRALPGAVAKRGAEGLLCGALAGGGGFALKAEDGGERALVAAAGGLLEAEALLEEPLTNSRGERTGALRAEAAG